MILSDTETLDIVNEVLRRDVIPYVTDPAIVGSLEQINDALAHLRARQALGPALGIEAARRAAEVAGSMVDSLSALGAADSAAALKERMSALGVNATLDDWGSVLDDGASQLLSLQMNAEHPHTRGRVSEVLAAGAEWEGRFLDTRRTPPPSAATSTSATADGTAATDSGARQLTAARLEAILRSHPDVDAGATVSDFDRVTGGLTKETYFFTLTQQGRSESLVVRKDGSVALLTFDAWAVPNEFELLRCVHRSGAKVPEPLWLFPDPPEVDGAFMIMRRAAGSVAGTNGTLFDGSAADVLLRSLAEQLARLHSTPVAEFHSYADHLGIDRAIVDSDLTEVVRHQVDQWYEQWLTFDRKPSPSDAFMFDFLFNHVPTTSARPSMVHSDCGFHNLLRDGDRVTALLDWESAHLGDPAEDLAYVEEAVAKYMDWDEFLDHYRRAGGPDVSPERIKYFKAFIGLRNASAVNKNLTRFRQGYVTVRHLPLAYDLAPRFRDDGMRAIADIKGH